VISALRSERWQRKEGRRRHPAGRPTPPAEGMKKSQAHGVRSCKCPSYPEARFTFQSTSPQSPAVALSLKNLVGWPGGPPVETSEIGAVFPEIN